MNQDLAFPVVGIGASAGGIEALEGLFGGVPARPGMAFVVVTHLSPHHESALPDILARFTGLRVEAATDGLRLRADTVYVIPPGVVLGLEGGRLVHRQTPAHQERKPVDVFFSELARECGEQAAGVILSGGDADGTLGLKAIKEAGGLALAQVDDVFGPRHPDMPNAAITAGFVDIALPAHDMGAKLMEILRGAHDVRQQHAGPSRDETALGDVLPEIYAILRSQVGHDFSGYKKLTFVRRVQRRMQIRQIEQVDAYLQLLGSDPEEVGLLFRDLLINVTSFFRDPEAFEVLASQVIPSLLRDRGREETVRIWVPGCATGEEVYSIAMLVRECLDGMPVVPRVQIFATDIDDRALAVARTGRYPLALLDSVTPERRERFFFGDGPSRLVAKEIRDLCIFSPHSVIRDPPFSRIDLVSCRNLLIYFGPDVQARVMPTFHYALKPDGFLFLGSAENVTQFEELFSPVDKHHRIFRRRSVRTPSLQFPSTALSRGARAAEFGPRTSQTSVAEFRNAVDAHVLERFAPAHVVVNSDGDVVYFSARTGKYLEMPAGSPTRQLLTLARRDLRLDLRNMLREALETGRAVHRESVAVELDGGRVQMLSLSMDPFTSDAGSEPLYMIVFNDHGPMLSREEALGRLQANQNGASLQTERELRDTRERLQSLIEEYETALEELKSSNEELVSVNEELQSTNEELEASKEELQSVNEELHTVNSELNGKVDALDRANADLVNLFEATDVATVFLDQDLVIRSFTPAVSNVLNIRAGDMGRPVTDLSSRVALENLPSDLNAVLQDGQVIERRTRGGDPASHYLVRIAPYVDGSRRREGVVVTFLDVTTLVKAEERQQVLLAELQHRTRNLLGLVQAIARKTLPASDALDGFFGRLEAIGRTQSLVGRASQEALKLGDVLRQELESVGGTERARIQGPDIALPFDTAQTFALALHELATNAAKYGALSVPGGRVDVTWAQEGGPDEGATTLVWREHGVRIAAPPERSGFGRELIERALSHTLQARTELVFEPDGVVCTIAIPQRRLGTAGADT